MSLREQTLPATSPEHHGEPRPEGGGFRPAGVLVVLVGLLLLSLAAVSALAGAELGGRGDDALHGSARDDRPAEFGGEDRIWGLAGEDVLSGGGGDDELYGGSGRDVLLGGAGDDFIESKDGEHDYVDCGPGEDVASVDLRDSVSHTCKRVYAA